MDRPLSYESDDRVLIRASNMFKPRWSERRFATLYDAGTVFWDTHHCFHIGATRRADPGLELDDPAPRGRADVAMTSRRRRSLKLLPVPRAAPGGAPGTRPRPEETRAAGASETEALSWRPARRTARSAVERFRLREGGRAPRAPRARGGRACTVFGPRRRT